MESPISTPEHETPRHPIAVVADRTGLSQDLLRVWERRYRAVEPGRRSDGRRLYSDADIARVRLLYAATNAGRSIGQVAALPTEELARIADEDTSARQQRTTARDGDPATNERSDDAAAVIDEALTIAATLEAAKLEHVLRRSSARFGLTSFIEEV